MKKFYCNGKLGFCDFESKDRDCTVCEFADWSGGQEIECEDIQNNPYWERICRLSEKQRAKGMETYGQGLEKNPAAIIERLNHLEEELIDALMYCEWIKEWFTDGNIP